MDDRPTFFTEDLATPTGPLAVVVDTDQRLRAVHWTDGGDPTRELLERRYGAGAFELRRASARSDAARALTAYFEGDLAAIDDLPVEAPGTPFQRAVWAALRSIPCGVTASYADVARRIGRPAAVRAVGLANHANPVGIVVPCHRVIGKDGRLTGYGGGIDRKRWLLAHEGAGAGAGAALA
jgi:methylated-DNA-[protein]-cysteine S-methyltransferase